MGDENLKAGVNEKTYDKYAARNDRVTVIKLKMSRTHALRIQIRKTARAQIREIFNDYTILLLRTAISFLEFLATSLRAYPDSGIPHPRTCHSWYLVQRSAHRDEAEIASSTEDKEMPRPATA
jgi:hypothetical protein